MQLPVFDVNGAEVAYEDVNEKFGSDACARQVAASQCGARAIWQAPWHSIYKEAGRSSRKHKKALASEAYRQSSSWLYEVSYMEKGSRGFWAKTT